MVVVIIKLLYFLLGSLVGYCVSRFIPSKFERNLYKSLYEGRVVTISIDEHAYRYTVDENKKLQVQYGLLNEQEMGEDDVQN